MDDRPAHLHYHRAIFELMGREPRVSVESLRRIERREEACGSRFPASVREWYALEGAEDLLRRYCGNDEPVRLDGMGSLEEVRWGWIHVMSENQGVASWVVRLDGSEDPPVDVLDEDCDDSAPPRCVPWSSSFSVYIFDVVSTGFIDAWFRELQVSAVGSPPNEADLDYLRGRLTEGPRTAGGGDRLVTHRFFDADGLVTFQEHSDEEAGNGGPLGRWCIQARTDDGLYNLCKIVWPIGTLSSTLESDCHTLHDNRADDVLRRLGRTIEHRPHPPVGWANPEFRRERFRAGFLATGVTGAWLLVGGFCLYGLLRLMSRWNGRAPSAWRLAVFLGGFWMMIVFFTLVAPAIGWMWWLATGRPDGRRRKKWE